MVNSIHSHQRQPRQTKEFDFVFMGEEALSNCGQADKGTPPSVPPTVSAFDREALKRFHEEFKSLVIAANQFELENEELAWDDTSLRTPIEPHEIEWLIRDAPDALTLASTPVPTQTSAPQQTIKPFTGPPLGTPPPVERWVIKVIGALVILNLLFAGLIVSDTRVNDWLNRLSF